MWALAPRTNRRHSTYSGPEGYVCEWPRPLVYVCDSVVSPASPPSVGTPSWEERVNSATAAVRESESERGMTCPIGQPPTTTARHVALLAPRRPSARPLAARAQSELYGGVTRAQGCSMAPSPLPHKKIVKKRTLKFSRHQSDEFVKVRAAWRRPRGIDSRQRIK